MSRSQRDKGKRGEREAAAAFRGYGIEARRAQQYHGAGSADLVVGIEPPLHVEVKRTERLRLYEALDQATADADGKATPIVMHRRNGREWVVILTFDDFLKLGRTEWSERKGLGS